MNPPKKKKIKTRNKKQGKPTTTNTPKTRKQAKHKTNKRTIKHAKTQENKTQQNLTKQTTNKQTKGKNKRTQNKTINNNKKTTNKQNIKTAIQYKTSKQNKSKQ